ncbi:MAG: methionyl-tRNA formyltransferase [Candidatus Pacebacteria bacterium]|nr:methionyl-tRNA formyltransferase [Candidatus Paceibacterota bacterium]
MNIAFWGTPELTKVYLDALKDAGMTPVVVITNPDRPKGRGQELAPTPAKVWALANNIPVLQLEKLDEAFKLQLSGYNLDVSVVVAYGKIISNELINLPKHGTINVHYSLLPHLRGASPTESAILAGNPVTGVSIQVMQYKLDSGPIIATATTEIEADETTTELRSKLTDLGAKLLVWTLPDYIEDKISPVPQDESLATHSGKIKKEDGLLDINGDALTNYRKYRAYIEWPRTYFFKNGKRVIITKARYENDSFIIERVLPEGKKEISYADFSRQV